MNLKCIGGKCDGTSIYVEQVKYREEDVVRVYVLPKLSAVTSLNSYEPLEDSIKVDFEYYKITTLKYKEKDHINEIWFLRPVNFTIFDAIQFQFLK